MMKKSTSRLCCTHTNQTENKQKIQYQDISFKAYSFSKNIFQFNNFWKEELIPPSLTVLCSIHKKLTITAWNHTVL